MKAFNDCVIVDPETVEGREKVVSEVGIIVKEEATKREGARVFLAFGTVIHSAIDGIKRGDVIGYNPYDSFEFKRKKATYECVPKVAVRVIE